MVAPGGGELVTEVERERAWWNAQAATEETMRAAVWPGPWDEGIESCLAEVLPAIGTALNSCGRVLDLGCGVGRLAVPLARRHPAAVICGVDVSDEMLDLVPGDGMENLFLGGHISMIGGLTAAYSVAMFQHVPPDVTRDYIGQVARALVPGGVFRFQFSTVGDGVFLSWPLTEAQVVAWCEASGLAVAVIDRGRIETCWVWITAVKR